MSLLQAINGLSLDQLRGIAKELDVAGSCFDKRLLAIRIIGNLNDFYRDKTNESIHQQCDILKLWRDFVYQIIEQRKCKPKNAELKRKLIWSLATLQSPKKFKDADVIESIVRDILLLLWQESSEAERQRFKNVIREELDKHKIKFTEKEFNKALQNSFIGSTGGALPIVVPIISGVMLQQMTNGLIGWFAVTLLGKHALQVGVLGALAGPVGWGLAIGSAGVGLASSAWKYQSERKKLKFIQAILSIYSYSYQNNFNKRREAILP